MGTTDTEFTAAILPSLRDGTFPSTDELLTSEVSRNNLSAILDEVSKAKKELSDEIRGTFQEQGKDVDQWIIQAKKVQADIARCKDVAREVVREHEKVRNLDGAVQDAQAKLNLLQDELLFSSTVHKEFESVRGLNRDLDAVQGTLANGDLIQTANRLHELRTAVSYGRSSRTKDLLNARREGLANKAHAGLEGALDDVIKFGRGSGTRWVEMGAGGEGEADGLDKLLEAFQQLGTLHKITTSLTARLEDFIIRPLLDSEPEACVSATVKGGRLSLTLSPQSSSVSTVLENCKQTIKFLHSSLPELVKIPVAAHLLPALVSKLIKDRLMPSVPYDLADMGRLYSLQIQTRSMADLLVSFEWPCSQELFDWIAQAPGLWLTRRKIASLHSVRKALSSPRGPVRQVERIETEIVPKEEADVATSRGNGLTVSDPVKPLSKTEDEEASGWGFDEAEDTAAPEQPDGEQQTREDDAEAAWGWDDDESPETPSKSESSKNNLATNGLHAESHAEREMTLVETYTITDIPDYLLETVGRDILDSQTVKDPEYTALDSISPSKGLMALPNLVLAMFRATASTYYTTTLNSGNMHLYNDTIYIAQKLREASMRTDDIEADCKVMEKFGRSAYAREMDIQRTILGDLLDGAQGFVGCTQSPNSSECEIAVMSCVDRIRTICTEWSLVLSRSVLLQSIGSLISSVIGKIVENIEDMDDISEPESKRLTSFCNQLSALEDIFMPEQRSPPEVPSDQDGPVLLTALYVPNWLKFQYLINILEASLVDIKWLWTEGYMSSEFEADEVADLIKALFAESTHRRNAIAAIRQHASLRGETF